MYTLVNPSFTIYKSGVYRGINHKGMLSWWDTRYNSLIEMVLTGTHTLWFRTEKETLYEPRCEKTGSSGFPTRPDTNQAVQPQKMARGLKFRI